MPKSPEGGETAVERLMKWCQPATQKERVWIVRFEDPDKGEAVFTGPDAEAEARDYYERATISWNCWLFAAAPVLSPQTPTAGEGTRYRAIEEAVRMADSQLGTLRSVLAYRASPSPMAGPSRGKGDE